MAGQSHQDKDVLIAAPCIATWLGVKHRNLVSTCELQRVLLCGISQNRNIKETQKNNNICSWTAVENGDCLIGFLGWLTCAFNVNCTWNNMERLWNNYIAVALIYIVFLIILGQFLGRSLVAFVCGIVGTRELIQWISDSGKSILKF